MEQSLPHTRIALWLDGDQLRAVVDHVLVAEYACHYSWRTHRVTALHHSMFYATRFVSPQGMLFPFNPHESLILYRPPAGGQRNYRVRIPQQLPLFQVEP